MTKHQQTCDAPICVDDHEEGFVWYAGEEICKKKSSFTWQKMQKRINKYLKTGKSVSYQDEPLNVRSLETRLF